MKRDPVRASVLATKIIPNVAADLAKEMGLEVHAALANTGGFSAEELAKIEKRAYDLGVKSYVALDVTQDYYNTAIKYMIFGNVLKNATYPISVSSERMSQATAIAKYAE